MLSFAVYRVKCNINKQKYTLAQAMSRKAGISENCLGLLVKIGPTSKSVTNPDNLEAIR